MDADCSFCRIYRGFWQYRLVNPSIKAQTVFSLFLTSIIIVRDDHAGYSNEGGEMMAKEGGLGLRMNQ